MLPGGGGEGTATGAGGVPGLAATLGTSIIAIRP
jgi:hypothetical protein